MAAASWAGSKGECASSYGNAAGRNNSFHSAPQIELTKHFFCVFLFENSRGNNESISEYDREKCCPLYDILHILLYKPGHYLTE